MLTLLSPAKKLNFDAPDTSLAPTKPRFNKDVSELAKVAKTQSADDLKRLMHISDNLAELNAERFKVFNLEGKSNSAKQAVLSFDGDVYWGLDAKSMSDSTLEYAQSHLRILSGLYGVLRPLDAIQPHRLEMGTKLETKRGGSLYNFWGSQITQQLLEDLSGHHDQTIMNLASNEYFKAVDKKVLDRSVVTAKFVNVKDGKSRVVMYYAKHARGQMARWIMDNRVSKAADLKDFDLGDYKFMPKDSSESELVFSRKQPPPRK